MGAFAWPDFRFQWAHQATVHLGVNIRETTENWLMLTLTNSPFLVASVGAAKWTTNFCVGLLGGVAADRWDRRRLVMTSVGLSSATIAVLGVLVLMGGIQAWHLVLFSGLSGVIISFWMPASQALVPRLVPREQLANANALGSYLPNGGRSLGPALAGLLMDALGVGFAFLGAALCYFSSLWSARAITADRGRPPHRGAQAPLRSLQEGLRYAVGDPVVLAILLAIMIPSMLGRTYVALMPFVARDVLGLGAGGLGLLLAASGLGGFAGATVMAGLGTRGARGSLLLLSGALYGVALLGLGLSQFLVPALVSLFLVGLTSTLLSALGTTMLQLMVPDYVLGRVMGMNLIAFLGSTSLGNLLLGGIASLSSVPLALEAGGAGMVLAILAVALASPALRRWRPSAPGGRAD